MKGRQKRSPMLRALAMLLAVSMLFTSSGFQVMAQEISTEQQADAAAEAARIAAEQQAAAEAEAARIAAEQQAAAEAEAARIAAEQQAAAEAAAKAAAEQAAAEAAAKAAAEQAAAEAAAKAAAEQAAADAAAAEAAAKAAAEQQAAEEKAAAEAAAKAAAEQAAADAAAAKQAQEALAAQQNKNVQNIPATKATEAASEESEPVKGGKLVLTTDAASVQEKGGAAKLKVEYGLGEGSEVKEVETKLYIKNADVKLTQFDENGKFVEASSQRTFLLKTDAEGRYIEYKLQAGEHFKQEFLFVDETAEAGETVTFDVVFKTAGNLPEEKKIQETAAKVTYTAPEKSDEKETAETTESTEAETVVENVVTFTVADGAMVTVAGADATNTTAMAKDGTIYFNIHVAEGFELTEVLVDGYIPARTTGNAGEYIIENIKTNETIVSVATKAIETEAPQTEAIEIIETEAPVETEVETEAETEIETEVETEVETEIETEVETEVETEIETEIETEVETEIETEVETEVETEIETEVEYGTEFVYEDGSVIIKATASEEAKLPKDAKFVAVRMAEGSAFYNDAVATAESQLGDDDTAAYVCWDVYFEVNGERVEPEAGYVSVSMSFKEAVFEEYDVTDAADVSVIHINEETGVAEDVTDGVSVSGGDVSELGFTTTSFSAVLFKLTDAVDEPIEVYGAPDGAIDITYSEGKEKTETVLVNNKEYQNGTVIERDSAIGIRVTYTFDEFPTADQDYCYKLPLTDELVLDTPKQDLYGYMQRGETIQGKFRIVDGYMIFYFYEAYLAKYTSEAEIGVRFTVNMKVDESEGANDNEIIVDLPTEEVTIPLRPSNINATKTHVTNPETGEMLFTIKISPTTADVNYLELKDTLTGNLAFVENSFELQIGDGAKVPLDATITGNVAEMVINQKIPYGTTAYVTYKVVPTSGTSASGQYGNKLDWGVGEQGKDGKGSTSDGTIDQEFKENILDKNASVPTKNNEITYTIEVNKLGLDLIPEEEEITLVDILDPHVTLKSISGYGSASGPLSDEKFRYYPEDNNKLVMIIPDGEHVTLTYVVKIEGKAETSLDIKNTVSFSNNYNVNDTTETKAVIQSATIESWGKVGDIFIRKQTVSMTPINGASFSIYAADPATGNAIGAAIASGVTAEMDEGNGYIKFSGLGQNKLYYIQETDAPEGYLLNNTKYYFVLYDDSTEETLKEYDDYMDTITDTIAVNSFVDDGSAKILVSNSEIPTDISAKAVIVKKTLGGLNPGHEFQFNVERVSATYVNNNATEAEKKALISGEVIKLSSKGSPYNEYELPAVTFSMDAYGNYCKKVVYKITEENAGTIVGDYYHDTAVYYVTITVSYDADKNEFKDPTVVVSTDEAGKNVVKEAEFENQDVGTELKVIKKAETNNHQGGTFNFKLSGIPSYIKTVNIDGTDKNVNSNGEVSFTITVAAGSNNSNEVVIKGLPAGNKVTISESNLPAGWTVKTETESTKDVTINTNSNEVEFSNTYSTTAGKWTPAGTKKLTGRPMYANDTFTFGVYENGTKVSTGTVTGTTAGVSEKAITFEEITYEKPGTHKYVIKEDAGSIFGVDYTDAEYNVTVNVVDNGKGKLEATATYEKGATGVTFTNSYTIKGSWKPTANKKLVGPVDSTETFTFSVVDEEGTTVSTGTVTGEGVVTFTKEIEYSEADAPNGSATKQYTIKEDKPQSPDANIAYDDTSYKVIVVLSNDGKGDLIESITYQKGNETVKPENVTFYNTYKAEGIGTITGTKALVNKELEAGVFNFGLYTDRNCATPAKDADGENIETSNTGAAANEINLDTPTYTLNTAIDGTQNFSESGTGRTSTKGEFTYYVKEIPGSDSSILYDETVYEVVIQVSAVENSDTLKVEVASITKDGSNADLSFTNTYRPEGASFNLAAKKNVSGQNTFAAGAFSFNLYDVTDGSEKLLQTKNTTGTVTGTQVAFDSITYTRNADEKDKTGYVYIDSANANFIYKVEEVNTGIKGYGYDKTEYYVFVVVTDNGAGKLNVAQKVYKDLGKNEPYNVSDTVVTFTNEYEASGEVTISGSKVLTGDIIALEDAKQDFIIELYNANASGVISGEAIQTAVDKTTGAFSFKLDYTQNKNSNVLGTHYYVIKERLETYGGYTYDESKYLVTVEVRDKALLEGEAAEPGKLDVTATYKKAGTAEKEIKFSNDYSVEGETTLTATKTLTTVEGTPIALNLVDPFTFVLKPTGDTANVHTTQTDTSEDGISFSLSFTKPGTYTYQMYEDGTEPREGYTFDGTVYDVTITATDNGEGGLNISKVIKNGNKSENEPLNFTNTYQSFTSVELNGLKRTPGKKDTMDTFKFELYQNDKLIATTKNGADGKFAFSGLKELSFTQEDVTAIGTPTVYTYTVKEYQDNQNGEKQKPGYTYDTTEWTVTVTLTDDGKGNLTAAKSYSDGKDSNATGVTFTNNYAVEGSFTPTAVKALTGSTLRNDNKFTFQLSGDNLTAPMTATNKLDGTVTFDTITYTQDDIGETYTYTLTEIPGTAPGYKYNTEAASYTIKVAITDNNGALKVDPTYFDKDNNEVELKDLVFTNTYEAKGSINFSGTKTLLDGRDLKAEDFTFVIVDTDTGKEVCRTMNEAPTSGTTTGAITFPTINYTQDDVYFDGNETQGTRVFHYAISETDKTGSYVYDETVYKATVTVTDNGDGTLEVEEVVTKVLDKTSADAEKDGVDFTNYYRAHGDLTFKAVKTLKTNTSEISVQNEQFTFELSGFELTDPSNKVQETAKNNENGIATFTKLDYTQEDIGKTYLYTVSERSGSQGGFIYDDEIYTAIVTITDPTGEGELVVNAIVTDVAGEIITGTTDNVFALPFENEYHATATYTFDPRKTLDGKSLQAGRFSFELTGYEITDPIICTNAADGSIVFGPMRYDESDLGKDIEYTVREVITTEDAGKTAYIYDETIYTVEINLTDNGDGTLEVEDTITRTPKVGEATTAQEILFANSYVAVGSLPVQATKVLDGRTLEEGQFSFKLSSTGLTPYVSETVTNDADGVVSFTTLSYTQADIGQTYTYLLEEVIPLEQAKGYVYDGSVYEISVAISDNDEDGELEIVDTYRKIKDKAGLQKNVSATEDTLTFNNEYHAEGVLDFEVQKILNGKALQEGQFEFELSGTGIEEAIVKSNAADGTVTFDSITYDEDELGTYVYTIKELKPEDAKAGYQYDATVYTLTVEVTDKGDGTLNVDETLTKTTEEKTDSAEKVVFVNDYSAEGEFTITATKNLTGHSMEEGQFTFNFRSTCEGQNVNETISNAAAELVENVASDTITFTTLTFDQDDIGETYTYTLQEVIPEERAEGYTYDEGIYEIEISITDTDEDGELEIKDTINYVTGTVGNETKKPVELDELEFNNEYHAEGVLEFDVQKVLNGRTLEEGQFSFELSGYEIDPENPIVKANAVDGTVAFEDIKYDETDIGTHTYTIRELLPTEDVPGYEYDGTVYTVNVVVTDNHNGTLNVEDTITKLVPIDPTEPAEPEGDLEPVDLNDSEEDNQKIVFTNTYKATGKLDLSATKVLVRRVLDAEQFAFSLTSTDAEQEVNQIKYNDEKGMITFDTLEYTEADAGKTYTYIMKEVIPEEKAKGYTYDETTYHIVVEITDNGDGTLDVKHVINEAGGTPGEPQMKPVEEVVFENIFDSEVIVSKVALTGVTELEGAELQILDAEGKVAVTAYGETLTWISGKEAKVITGLVAGDYVLNEIKSPDGYGMAEDISFTITDKGEVIIPEADKDITVANKIVMKDKATEVYISKMDVTNNAELEGAHLVLKDAEGNIVADWVSTGKPKKLFAELIAGATYTLTEISAPAGYDIAEDITFTVNMDGTVQTVVMEDKVSDGKGSIAVQKLVMQNGKYIPVDYTFYVALFEDEACTKRISSVKPLFVNASFTTSTIFTNLQYGTYYVAETDEQGNAITSGFMIESNQVIDGKVTLTPSQATAKSTIINHVAGFREDYYNDGEITVNKTVLINGVKGNVNDTFYFALFMDPALTMMADAGVVSLELNNESQGSVVFEGIPYGTYYLAETDANGVPVDTTYEYTATVDSSYISLTAENKTAVRSVVNSKQVPVTPEYPTYGSTASSVKTGDETPILAYLLAMLSAVTVFVGALLGRRRRRVTK